MPCYCGRKAESDACCGRYLGGNPAPDPESLMRSRYTAYVLGNAKYLLETWHPNTRPEELDLSDSPKWLGLEIKKVSSLGPDSGMVEFVARYKIAGRAHRLHETSCFRLMGGKWFYLEGEVRD